MSASTTSYTHENLTAVEDSAPKFGFEEVQEARFASDRLEAADTGISYHRVLPGKRQAFAHRHDEAEEIYVIVAGKGRMKLDDETGFFAHLFDDRGNHRTYHVGRDGAIWTFSEPESRATITVAPGGDRLDIVWQWKNGGAEWLPLCDRVALRSA